MDEKYIRWARLLAEDYNQRILAAAMGEPITTQELAPITGIPIAVAYRRINALADAGLLRAFNTHTDASMPDKNGRRIVRLMKAYKSILVRFDMAIDFGKKPPMTRLEFLLLGGGEPFFVELDLKLLRKQKPEERAMPAEQVVPASATHYTLDGRLGPGEGSGAV